MGGGQKNDPVPGGLCPECRVGAPPTGTGPQDRGPPPTPKQPTRRGTRGGGGAYWAASGARHTGATDTTAEADPRSANPAGCTRRPRHARQPRSGTSRRRVHKAPLPHIPPPGHSRGTSK